MFFVLSVTELVNFSALFFFVYLFVKKKIVPGEKEYFIMKNATFLRRVSRT